MAMDTQRVTAWSLAVIAFILAVFVPLGYLELRRQGRLLVPNQCPGQSIQPKAASANPPAAVAPDLGPPQPCSESVPEPPAGMKPGSLTNLGDFHLRRGEYDEAIHDFQEALKADPGNTIARKKLDSAIADCKRENAVLNEGLKCGAP